jgi:glutamate synthase domain-containing protein 2
MEKIVNMLNIKESDAIISQFTGILLNIYTRNDYESSITNLQQVNKNNKITVKLFNLIGVSLMSKGEFESATKALVLGKELDE